MNDMHDAAVEMGRRGGKKGGRSRARKLSPEQRSAIASHAALKRWGHNPIYPIPDGDTWLKKAKGALELIEYHDTHAAWMPLHEWFRDVVRIYAGDSRQNGEKP